MEYMPYSIEQLFEDHKEFLFIRASQAQAIATDAQWASIKGCLASKYKFQLDESNFAATLAQNPTILPVSRILRSGAKHSRLFVRYDYMSGQDAAVHELLRCSTRKEFLLKYPSDKLTDVAHSFSEGSLPPSLTGIIHVDGYLSKRFINQWTELVKYSIANRTNINNYLSKLKELSNEQV